MGIGCIFAEMSNGRPLFPGTSESNQLERIFKALGTPTPEVYPGVVDLPEYNSNFVVYPPAEGGLAGLMPSMTPVMLDLVSRLLQYDPNKRISAKDALSHPFFKEVVDSTGEEGQSEAVGEGDGVSENK